MKIFNTFIAFLWTLVISVEFPHGSVSVTRVLNVGDNMTLDCVTDWNPDINMYWVRRKNGSDQYLAKDGTLYPKREINGKFRYDPRISVSYYSFVNASSDKVINILALNISNITEQDSAEYICLSKNVSNTNPIYLYFYVIRVVTCNCSIDTNVTCDLIGFNSHQRQPVTIIFEGGTIKTEAIGNRLTFSPQDLNELALEPSIRLFSDDGLMSDITCILPVHSNPSSTRRTTTTVLPSQPKQSSAQDTKRIVDPTNEPSSSHQLLSTMVISSQYTKLTTMRKTTTAVLLSQPSQSSTIKDDDHDSYHGNMIITALAVSILVVVLIVTAVAAASIWRRALRSKRGRANLDTTEDCSDSTDWNFSRFATHLNHECESTVPVALTSMCTEVEDSALAYPSSFLPLPDTSLTSQNYEEVGNNLQEDTDADDYTFPNVRGQDNQGYCVMVSNVKDGDPYAYSVPSVTLHNIIPVQEYDDIKQGEGSIVPTANRAPTIDDKDEDDYLVPYFKLCKDKMMMSTSD